MATNPQVNNLLASNTPASNPQVINQPAISQHFINSQTNSSQASSSQASSSQTSTAHVPAFEWVLQEFKEGLEMGDLERCKTTTLADVENLIEDLVSEKQSSYHLIDLRLKPLLEALDQYGTVMTVFCNSSKFVPFIWVSKTQLQLKKRLNLRQGPIWISLKVWSLVTRNTFSRLIDVIGYLCGCWCTH
jgi:hypothetical protein